MRAARAYLSARFPLLSQGGPVLSAYLCCYLLFGQIEGRQAIGWETAVGAVTVVLLALIRRIVDDIEDLREDVFAGPASFDLRGLVAGGLAAVVLAMALNAACSVRLLLVSLAVAAWIPLMAVTRYHLPPSRTLAFVLTESSPAAILVYSYVVWRGLSATGLVAVEAGAVLGLFWTIYEFWSFTRKIRVGGQPPWGLSLDGARRVSIGLLALTAALSALVTVAAHLSVAYLIYAFTLSLAFSAVIQRWWSGPVRRGFERAPASWAGLPFPVGVEVGVLLAVAMKPLGHG